MNALTAIDTATALPVLDAPEMFEVRGVSIFKMKPSTWRLKLEWPRNALGERAQSYMTVHGAKRDAEKTKALLLAGDVELVREALELRFKKVKAVVTLNKAKALQVAPVSSLTTVESYANEWLNGRLALKTRTRKVYTWHLGHIIAGLGNEALSTLTERTVRDFLSAKDTAGLSPRSLKQIRTTMQKIFSQAMRDGLMTVNPAVGIEMKKTSQSAGKIMDAHQQAQFLAYVKDHRLGLLARLALCTGLRRGEICGLQWRNIDLVRGRVTVDHQVIICDDGRGRCDAEAKSEAANRTIGIPAEVVEELRAAHAERVAQMGFRNIPVSEMRVFNTEAGRGWSPTHLGAMFRTMFIRAGLPGYSLHDLRHCHASHLLNSKLNIKSISKRLGHSDVRTTLQIYAHVLDNDDDALTLAAGSIFA
jgi:integrase